MTFAKLSLVLVAGLLAACGSEPTAVAPAAPVEVSDDATGHYCGMLLADHEGPKGQIHLASSDEPIWFSSVRDTIAFTRLPEEPKDITAIYVNDMGKVHNWRSPNPGPGRRPATPGSSSAAPGAAAWARPKRCRFRRKRPRRAFRAAHGGEIVRFDDIPHDYVLGPVELDQRSARRAIPATAVIPIH
jgi:copper chaperone NosL